MTTRPERIVVHTVDEMSAVGGLLMGIGLRLLDLAEVRVASFLAGIVLAPVLVTTFGR